MMRSLVCLEGFSSLRGHWEISYPVSDCGKAAENGGEVHMIAETIKEINNRNTQSIIGAISNSVSFPPPRR
jgi:hypothetical protein